MLLSLAILGISIIGCGPASTSGGADSAFTRIPVGFWAHINRSIRETGFPHVPGVKRCEIQAGGAHRPGSNLILATCTTQVVRSASSQMWAEVVLSEQWDSRTATFTFLINRKGEVLSESVSGQPPQLWK